MDQTIPRHDSSLRPPTQIDALRESRLFLHQLRQLLSADHQSYELRLLLDRLDLRLTWILLQSIPANSEALSLLRHQELLRDRLHVLALGRVPSRDRALLQHPVS